MIDGDEITGLDADDQTISILLRAEGAHLERELRDAASVPGQARARPAS